MSVTEKFSNGRKRLYVVAKDFEHRQHRHREKRTRKPQSHPQKLRPKKITTGFSVSRRPIMSGLTRVPIAIVNVKKVAGINAAWVSDEKEAIETSVIRIAVLKG